MTSLLQDAKKDRYAVGFFESWDYESTQAVIAAAEEMRSPVIIGFNAGILTASDRVIPAENLAHFGQMGRMIAEDASVPVALILNEITAFEMALAGIDYGFNALLFDDETKSLSEHIELSRRLVEAAHAVGIAVEGNVGRLQAAKGGALTDANPEVGLTKPEDAKRFAEETGIDAMGVAVGNIEVLMQGKATLRLDLLERISAMVDIPLVLHGGSGIPDEIVGELVRRGVCKMNLGAVLNESYWAGMRGVLDSHEGYVSPKHLLGSGTKVDILAGGYLAMKETVMKKIAAYGSAGKASHKV